MTQYNFESTFAGKSDFLSDAKFSGGLGMLVEQAAASFEIWHHQKPDTKSIYQIL